MHFFLSSFPGQSIEVCQAVFDGIFGACESWSILQIESGGRLNSPSQFDPGHDLAPCGFTDCGADFLEFRKSQFRQLFEAIVDLPGNFFAGLQCRFAGASGADQDGEEFTEF